ncbi:hypothetical protein [Oceanobacter kriegii]|uniref:hypothetical protein n=1 Tax=Oceanobacter kriegii TaxID=64972 RepID=UPI00048487BC|nr:hypothetical protein [Oceanobacter kriegii]
MIPKMINDQDIHTALGLTLVHMVVDYVEDGVTHWRRLDPTETELVSEIVAASIYVQMPNGLSYAAFDFDRETSNQSVRSFAESLLNDFPSLQTWGLRDLLLSDLVSDGW